MKSVTAWVSKHKITTAIVTIIIIVLIAGGGVSNKNNNSSTASNESATKARTQNTNKATAAPKIGERAYDGKFEFTVTSFKCGEKQIEQADNQYEVAKAQGNFCILGLSIKNIAKVSQSFDYSVQYLYNKKSVQYSAASEGTLAANSMDSQFIAYPTINPGVTISGNVAFDVPLNTEITSTTLHDSMYSNGVEVNLK